MTESMNDRTGKVKEDVHSGGASAPGAFSKLRKGLVEGLVVLGIAGGFLAKTACTYEVPPLEPLDVQDSGRPDATEDSWTDSGPDAMADAGHDGGDEEMDSGHDGGEGGMDAGHDAGEGGMDAGPTDGGYDGGEGGMDAGPVDSGVDSGYDAGEGGMDAGPTDGGVEAGPDAGDSGSPDAGIVCGAITTGSWSGIINTITAQGVDGYSFAFTGVDGSGNALMTISCTEGTVDTSYPCPVGIQTNISRPADGVAPAGRTIKITPTSATATNTQVFIQITHP